MSHFQLSYDFDKKLKKDNFSSYDEARRYLLCVLSSIPSVELFSFCESTIIIQINKIDNQKLFQYLKRNLKPYFFYFISKIAVGGDSKIIYSDNRNNELNKHFQQELQDLDCGNLEKDPSQY